MNVVFDLDGTLIDSRLRMYTLYQRLVPTTTLDFDSYWNYKRRKVPHEVLLKNCEGYSEEQIASFINKWMIHIETKEFLVFDSSFPGLPATLERLAQQARLHVCTARQFRQPVLEQLERLGLIKHFSSVLVTQHASTKEDLVASNLPGLSPNDWMVGDTGKDIEAGKMLGMRTCAVLSGFLNREILLRYEPDLILESAVDFDFPQ